MCSISVSSGAWLKEIGGCVRQVDLGVQASAGVDLVVCHPPRTGAGAASAPSVTRGLCGGVAGVGAQQRGCFLFTELRRRALPAKYSADRRAPGIRALCPVS